MTREQMVQNIEHRMSRIIADSVQGETEIESLMDLHAGDPDWSWLEAERTKWHGRSMRMREALASFQAKEAALKTGELLSPKSGASPC